MHDPGKTCAHDVSTMLGSLIVESSPWLMTRVVVWFISSPALSPLTKERSPRNRADHAGLLK